MNKVPEFSTTVFVTLQRIRKERGNEEGFSDVVSQDIADDLNVSVMAVNAAIGHLIEAGLVWTDEEWKIEDRNGKFAIIYPVIKEVA